MAHTRFILGVVLACLGLLGSVSAPAGEPEAPQASLTDYITAHGVASDSGWRTVAIQIDSQRFLLAQLGAAGDIYQLGDFDGMYVRQLEWKEADLLQVDWESPDRRYWRSLLRFDTESEGIELVEVEARRKLRNATPVPDMAVTDIDFGNDGPFIPLDARPGYTAPASNR